MLGLIPATFPPILRELPTPNLELFDLRSLLIIKSGYPYPGVPPSRICVQDPDTGFFLLGFKSGPRSEQN